MTADPPGQFVKDSFIYLLYHARQMTQSS